MIFGPDRQCVVVVGAQWGDEGKGKIVDVVSEQADYVVRFQGGANAGHTVVRGETQLILHQIPTGILHPGTACLIGNGVVLDPETLGDELDELAERGVEIEGRLFISDRAHLLLRHHKLLERAAERRQQIGTTGRGIGPAYEDKFGRRGVRLGDLRDFDRLRERLTARIEGANAYARLLGADEQVDATEQLELLERLAPTLLDRAVDVGRVTMEALRAGRHVLLEGAQGALLDIDHGTYPFVTSSSTTAGGALVGTGIGPTVVDAVLGVVKAYTTRVGNGPLPSVAEPEAEAALRELGGEYGATTGRPRRCGWFDAVAARYATRINGLTSLAVTKLDVLDTLETIPVCVKYRIDGEETDEFPADAGRLERAEPVLEHVAGWRESIVAATDMEHLPAAARDYLDRIEALLETPIALVSTGTRRDQIILAA
ncbi:MAG: adenylosuccinate synthase [Gemmatimonadales bacterium]